MKKRRKTAYIEYDYEEAYQKSLHDLEEANMERILKEGRVRSIYATKEIRAGDQIMDVEIYPEFARSQRAEIPEAARKKQRQAQKNLNEKNSRKMCERLINANFTDRDIWATFTYTDDNMPQDMKQAQKNMQNYIRRLNYQRKKLGLQNARYVYVTECSEKGRWHHHIVLDGDMPLDTVESLWLLGKRNEVRRLQTDENGLTGMAMYITKQKHPEENNKKRKKDEPVPASKYQKAWKSSKGLKKPEEKKNHYKFKQKDVEEIISGRKELQDKLMKWYASEGYSLKEFRITLNQWNGRFYISARLIRGKPKGGTGNGRSKKKEHNQTQNQKNRKTRTDQSAGSSGSGRK